MVLAVLAVVPLLALCLVGFFLVVRLRPAFTSSDELARWATRLNATEVRLTWLGTVAHVKIEPRLEPAPAVAEEPREGAPAVTEVDAALNRMMRRATRSAA